MYSCFRTPRLHGPEDLDVKTKDKTINIGQGSTEDLEDLKKLRRLLGSFMIVTSSV